MPRWTDESRRKQSEFTRENKPWLKSTGPKTEKGKKASSGNSMKNKGYSKNELYGLRLCNRVISELKYLNDIGVYSIQADKHRYREIMNCFYEYLNYNFKN